MSKDKFTMSMNVVLFGYGFLGKWHLEKLVSLEAAHEDIKLIGVVDPSDSAGGALREKFPKLKHYKKWQDIHESFNAAIVVTPTAYHAGLCEELLLKGCHIFCEKPITQTEAEALKILSLTMSKPKLVFQAGHSERMHAIWDKIKSDKDLTTAPLLHFRRVSPFKNRATDVDVISDLMIHDIDLISYLTGETPLEVSAVGLKQRTNHFDYVKANFKLLSGQEVVIESSRISCRVERVLEIFGKEKSALIDLASLSYSESRGEETQASTYEKRDHLYLEQKAFFESIRKESKPLVSASEGHLAVKIVEAVRKSALLKMRVSIA